MKILHTADWHIGNFNGPVVNGENARFLDIRNYLSRVVGIAVEEKPEFIIVAGDIFHQARVWSDRGLRESQTAIECVRQLEKVAPVIIVRGTPNHDSEQQFRMLQTSFEEDRNVHILTEPGVRTVTGYTGQSIDVAALPGFDRGYFRAMNPGLDRAEETKVFSEALNGIIMGMKAQCSGSRMSVLVGHYTVAGSNMESGQVQLFSQYEPVIEPYTLAAAGFDLSCFGHIHRWQKLDGCGRAYYSGAIAAYNFNDEGQERGLLIHEDTGTRFIEIDCRKFKTIRLADEDIRLYNKEGLMPWASGVDSRIVRVLYSCTDEHNKALNKTAMEKELYARGTFWVQEITPETITVAASRSSLSTEDGPEDNLRKYLREKEIEEATAGRIVERARKFIAEAEQATMKRHAGGTLVPVEIEVKNYRNYKEETFNFDWVKFCTINGENGAGKSSLFMDAMCDALFEETREGDLSGWISNSEEARSGSIKFTFRLGERLYRVSRTRMKSGRATLNLAEMVEGVWTNRSKEKLRDTQAEILNAIGMDSLTLKATGLIMQDQYGLFLTADKESRMSILGKILGLEIYSHMEESTVNALADCNREVRSLKEKASELDGLDSKEKSVLAYISRLQADLQELQGMDQEVRARISELSAAMLAADEVSRRVVWLNSEIEAETGKISIAISSITAQQLIVTEAEKALSERERIEAGVAEYESIAVKLSALEKSEEEYSDLICRISSGENRIALATSKATQLKRKAEEIQRTRIAPANALLQNEASLREKHGEYEELRAELERLESARPAYLEAKQKVELTRMRLKDLERRAVLLEDNGCPYAEETECVFLKDAIEAMEMMPGVREELLNLIALTPKDYTEDRERAVKRHLEGFQESEAMYSRLDMAKTEVEHASDMIREFNEEIVRYEEETRQAQAEVQELTARKDVLGQTSREYKSLKGKLAQAERWKNKEKQLPVAQERYDTASRRITELEAEAQERRGRIVELEAEKSQEEAKASGRQATERKLMQAKDEEKCISDRIMGKSLDLGAAQKELQEVRDKKSKLAGIRQKVDELSVEASDLDILKKAFSQDGIPHNIVRSIIPIFEATATNILGQMSNGHMSVEFVMEKTLKSNSKKEVTALDIVINDSQTGRLPYMSRSGGERVKAALAVILALAEIKSTKAGVQLGFLFIDEPPFLDRQGVTAYCDALETIQRRYSDLKVMAITHDPEMKSRFPQSVDVVKTENGSRIIYN